MKKYFLTVLAILTCIQFATAQKASDVLENGIQVKKGHRLFIKYDLTEKVLKIDAAKKYNEVDFTTLEDSIIFLVRKNEINVYLRPLNPLNYSYNTEKKVIIDPINVAVADGMLGISDILKTVSPEITRDAKNFSDFGICPKYETLKNNIENIQKKLSRSKKDEILRIFDNLKSISFYSEQSTKDDLATAKGEIIIIAEHFKEIDDQIKKAKLLANDFDGCDFIDGFIGKHIFNLILKDLLLTVEEQKKRFTNLQTAYKLVEDMQKEASIGGGTDELNWCIQLNKIQSKEGKISIFTVTIKESGYKFSEKAKEIVSIESMELLKKTVRIRYFQRFVPEVSVGTAYTFLKYNSYGTTSDSAGIRTKNQYVASPTENLVQNLNITTMINFNYFIPYSSIHPLYQIGVGVNSGIPTILTGFGLRSSINGIRRLAFSGGIAMTWIRELDTLKVGDVITGTDDIDKDYKFSSAPKFTPYIGIQYNF